MKIDNKKMHPRQAEADGKTAERQKVERLVEKGVSKVIKDYRKAFEILAKYDQA